MKVFHLENLNQPHGGFEPPTYCLKGNHSNQLS